MLPLQRSMANPSFSALLTVFLLSISVIAYSASPVSALGGGGTVVGGRKKIEDVESNKEIQDLGKYSVNEYNRLQHQKGSASNGRGGYGDLKFRKVVEAEEQVVSGVKYYLKIAASTSGGGEKIFEAEVVVQAWKKKSKELLNFGPSPATK